MAPPLTVEYYESLLGPADKFVPRPPLMGALRMWSKLSGHLTAEELDDATNVELTNLYHRYGPASTISAQEEGRALAKFLNHLAKTGYAPFNEDALRDLVAYFVQIAGADEPAIDAKISEALDKRMPREIHVINGASRVVLDGLTHEKTPEVIQLAGLGQPVMMVGPAGCGKTTIGEHVAAALQLPFYLTSTISDEYHLTGFIDGQGRYHTTPFRQAFENGGVWIADEIDAWDASALLSANAALANGFATFPDQPAPVRRHPNFRMIATANTFGKGADRVYVGRNQLDAASLDRYAIVEVDYDFNVESRLAGDQLDWCMYVREVRKKVEAKNIRHVVSTRAIMNGAACLRIGMDFDRVCEIWLYKGMAQADRRKIA